MQNLIHSLLLFVCFISKSNAFVFKDIPSDKEIASPEAGSQIGYSDSLSKKLIAFSSDASQNDKQQIFVMDADGGNVRQLTYMEMNCFTPRFSPDGGKIVFVASTPGSDYIYLIDLRDSASYGFPKFIDGGTDPVFSPDGLYLLYRSEKNLNNAIYLTELSTDSSEMVSDGSLSTHAKFSPDGKKIIYTSSISGNMDLVVVDIEDTTEENQKTIAESDDAELYGTFSPDGNLAAYASFDINYKGTVHVCNADGSSNKIISRGMGSSYNPKFSPDGKYLAFISASGDKFQIHICNPDGSGMKHLTSGNTTVFDWSSDSKQIVYENKGESVSSINIIYVESGSSTDLTGEKANNINPNIGR